MPVRRVNSAFTSIEPSVPLAMYSPQLYTLMVTPRSGAASWAQAAGAAKASRTPASRKIHSFFITDPPYALSLARALALRTLTTIKRAMTAANSTVDRALISGLTRLRVME